MKIQNLSITTVAIAAIAFLVATCEVLSQERVGATAGDYFRTTLKTTHAESEGGAQAVALPCGVILTFVKGDAKGRPFFVAAAADFPFTLATESLTKFSGEQLKEYKDHIQADPTGLPNSEYMYAGWFVANEPKGSDAC